ncbi:dTDP-4-dehydrorhamnose reductase [Rubrivivax gelatinosus]|uniref:dTDP-4-dehydrorhamnose reductase n=1 Tax=Rubrivivax gelatinosus TaxID=28068 RepID=A0A4R2M7B2_RUBGE|nr:dTDP-4-dehydrorhamnose reductase [Rubrivivax gelatinosus]MBK1688149.1 dTDP-4-dehydrorhamnose reductase [Rubrivivax gelatinosus]TCP02512.1 dTDP-4-dehydrorhamnose reductase [Rubrivivax gelatinosus]
MKLLLLGCGGQLGWELQRSLAPLGELVALDRDTGADFADPGALPALLHEHAPDVIVNAAAHTEIDRAEREPELAHVINAVAPGLLAREAAARGAWLVHYSTDYVFDGSGELARDEDAPAAPLSVYGRSKFEGEQQVRASGCRHLILRTSWLHAARGANFAKTMLALAAERDRLRVVADQVGAPTGADLLADVSAHVLRRAMHDSTLAGTYHCAAAGETSWHGYARFVVEHARAAGLPLRLVPEAIEPVPSCDYPSVARRPLNSRLDTRRLRQRFGLHLPHWQDGVLRLLDELLAGAMGRPER